MPRYVVMISLNSYCVNALYCLSWTRFRLNRLLSDTGHDHVLERARAPMYDVL